MKHREWDSKVQEKNGVRHLGRLKPNPMIQGEIEATRWKEDRGYGTPDGSDIVA